MTCCPDHPVSITEFLNTNLHESGWNFFCHFNGRVSLASGCIPKGMSDSISLFCPAHFTLLQLSSAMLQDQVCRVPDSCFFDLSFSFLGTSQFRSTWILARIREERTSGAQNLMLSRKGKCEIFGFGADITVGCSSASDRLL